MLPRSTKCLNTFAAGLFSELIILFFRYAEVGATANVEGVVPPTSWDIKDISDWLSGQVSEIIFGTPVYHTRDLFEQGMDR